MTADLVLGRALDSLQCLHAPDPSWVDILQSARHLIGADSATFMTFDGSGTLSMAQLDLDTRAQHDYVEHFHVQDIGLDTAMRCPSGTWLNTQEMLTRRDAVDSAYYVDFMCKHRMRQILCFIVEKTPTERACFSFQREQVDDEARQHLEAERITAYTRALRQALLARRDAATQWFHAAGAAFGALGEAVGLVTRTGSVLELSLLADEWLSNSLGLHVRSGRLWHPIARVREALSLALIKAACSGGSPVPLNVPAGHDSPPCRLELVQADAKLRLGNESLVFFRIRSRKTQEISTESLCAAFDITPAEARVLAALMEGQSAAQHAASRSTSIHTVRKQIAVLMEKLACTRQVDLVRMGLALQAY